jgi:hypothetical protein
LPNILVHADKKTNALCWKWREMISDVLPSYVMIWLKKLLQDSALDAAKPESQSTRAVHPLELGT